MSTRKLIFVYAVDGNFFSSITNFAHKILSPKTYACSLCSLTYGALKPKDQWVAFLNSLNMKTEFLHRDEFLEHFPGNNTSLPTVFIENGKGLVPILTAKELEAFSNVDALIARLREKITSV